MDGPHSQNMDRSRRLLRGPRAGALVLLGGASVLLGACGAGESPTTGSPAQAGGEPWFDEAAHERGLDFQHTNGQAGEYWVPEIMGGGCALLDMDADGDLDAYLIQSGSLQEDALPAQLENRLYANDGGGHFTDVTRGSGSEDPRYGMGVGCGDADGDGDTDILVTNYGRNTLLRNDGPGHFEDMTVQAALLAEGWNTSAVFFDYDRDGRLDLFVVRYVEWTKAKEIPCMGPLGRRDYCSPKSYKAPARSLLFHNLGQGRFEDVSVASGISSLAATGLGVASGDLDGDGWADVFVANDGMQNHQWRNLGDGRFENVAARTGCGTDAQGVPKAGMGILMVDMDDDLDLDVLICNLQGESDSYYRNEGSYFSDRTPLLALAGPSKPFTRFGMALGDFDHDGNYDLYQCNGRVERPREHTPEAPYAEPNLLLSSGADGRYAEVLPRGGTRQPLVHVSRGVAQGDVDGDGDLDLLVANNDGPAYLLVNRMGAGGNWILVRVLERSGADALGATLELEIGARRVRREVNAAFGYNSSHDPRVHVGLGTATRIDGLRVRWSDGTSERFGSLESGQAHTLQRGEGQAE